MKTLALLGVFLLAGCSSLAPTADQAKAMEGTQASYCATGSGWNGALITAHYATFGGRSTGTAGGSGKATCGTSIVEFVNEGRLVDPPKIITAPK